MYICTKTCIKNNFFRNLRQKLLTPESKKYTIRVAFNESGKLYRFDCCAAAADRQFPVSEKAGFF